MTYNDPLYIEIADYLCEKIIKGELKIHEPLNTAKIWAENAGLNPNAVEKAFEVLTKNGVVAWNNSTPYLHNMAKENAINYRKTKLLQIDITEFFDKCKLLQIKPQELQEAYLKHINK